MHGLKSTFFSRRILYGILLLTLIFSVFGAGNVPVVQAQDDAPPPDVDGDIVGGALATPGEYPWQVVVYTTKTGGTFLCGGSLIATQWVLTAGHCIVNDSNVALSPSAFDVYAGVYDRSNTSGSQHRDVIQVILHPSYENLDLDWSIPNDIALLKLSSPVILGGSGSSKTATIPLVPSNIGSLAGTNAWVTGWGATSYQGSTSSQLREVQVPIITNALCNDDIHYYGNITENMLCAGFEQGGKDACQGDSGGPLAIYSAGKWQLAGVVSSGYKCAEPYSQGIYTRVSQYVGWIQANIPPVQLTVARNGTGSGTVTSTIAGISCGADCSENYAFNTVVTLNAAASPGSMFMGWGGACSGNGSCVVTMIDARSVTATFNTKSFNTVTQWTTDFNNLVQGWSVSSHERVMGDVNNDGRDDIVGFFTDGVWVGTSTGTAFNTMSKWSPSFGNNQGWRVDQHPRLLGDLNNDGRDDLVGIGYEGVFVALSNGTGFGGMTKWTSNFNYNQGWRINQHPRMLGDVNGDGRADLIGFGNAGVLVTLSTGTGFGPITTWSTNFTYNQGWRVDQHPRMVADVNGDGFDDLIGFASDGVYVATSNGVNGFNAAVKWTSMLSYNQGWRVDQHPRVVADINGDGMYDIVGFGYYGVWIGFSNGSGFGNAAMLTDDFNYSLQGWRVNQHSRTAGDANGDGKDDLIGFGAYGVWVTTAK